MTDNLEQLEKDWPQKYPKNPADEGTMLLNWVAGSVLIASELVIAVLIMVHAKLHRADFWLVNGVGRLLAILFVCLSLVTGYRRIKGAAIKSGEPDELLVSVRYAFALMLVQIAGALLVLFNSMMFH
jgi:hypothetical protein